MAATTMPNTMRMTNPGQPVREVLEVTGGVDTHADTHTAAALDQVGGLLGTATFPATPAGYQDLAGWLAGFGPLGRVGVEGTGSYGAGLSRWLAAAEITVLEVNRPDRSDRRRRGKSDPIDAINAARAVLAGTATATPKSRNGIVEAIRVLHLTREGAVKARTAARNQFTNLLVTAPETVKARLAGLTTHQQLDAAAAFRPGDISDPKEATKTALRTLARRVTTLTVEIDQLYTALADLTAQAAPELRAEYGVGARVRGAATYHRRRQRRPARQRSRLRRPLRHQPRPGQLRTHRPTPPQPRRGPTSQPGPAHGDLDPHPAAPTHPRLPGPSHHRGPHQQRSNPNAQALPRPPPLPPPQHPRHHHRNIPRRHLTPHRSIAAWDVDAVPGMHAAYSGSNLGTALDFDARKPAERPGRVLRAITKR